MIGIGSRHDYDGKNGPAGHPDLKGLGANDQMFFWLKQGNVSPDASHIGLVAVSEEKVDEAYFAALGAGATSIHMPGAQLHYDPRYYPAKIRKPDGYSFEFVFKSWQHGH